MKNAGKACNNRLYRHIRTFEKIVKNYFVIFYKKWELGPAAASAIVLFAVVLVLTALQLFVQRKWKNY